MFLFTSLETQMLFYGILDLCTKPIFAFVVLSMLTTCDYAVLQLQSGKVSDTSESTAVRSKEHEQAQEPNVPPNVAQVSPVA